MPHILLLGAGFSRNWGGWLADEAFEYLLGCPQLDDGIRTVLWRYKGRGGFEAALSELQTETSQHFSVALLDHATKLDEAIRRMFADMNKAFAAINFEFQNSIEYLLRSCLVRFDAIFSLNQDVLMEQHYLNGNVALSQYRSWNGWQIPGMQQLTGPDPRPHLSRWSPMDPSKFVVEKNLQPYFKLHGSSNWIDSSSSGRPMLVIGGNKPSAIARHPILKWNHEQFKANLSKPNTRLMVIGYSFGDEHINVAIRDAAEKGTLKLFLIDPSGVDVLTKNRLAPPGYMFEKLQPHLIGASRRLLSEIFGGDMVEHGKVMRFFA